jgi:hypothetical protein
MAKIPGACNHTGKCSNQEMLPSRHALTTLTRGDPSQRTFQNYAKATPSGASGLTPTSMASKLGILMPRSRSNF